MRRRMLLKIDRFSTRSPSRPYLWLHALFSEEPFLSPPPPPPSPVPFCSSLGPGGPVVSLQWSTSFTSQHAVERYRVVVTPDPSSCSNQQVSPSENYTCSGLVLGTEYSFTVMQCHQLWESGRNQGDLNCTTTR